MEVEVIANGLERRVVVAVPAQQYDQEITNRLKSLSQRVKVDGFRVGKVPLKVVERRWGGSVRQEVREELVKSSFSEVIDREKLRPAGTPRFEFQSEEAGNGLRYTAVFEVYPEFELKIPDNFKINKPTATINDADIDKMVEKLRVQRQTWEPVTRGAQKGDRIVMDFNGTIDGKEFPGNNAKDYAVVLGSGTLLADFDANLLGLEAGQEKGFDIDFPQDYHTQDLAGKRGHFDVKVHSVSVPKLPELNEELFKSFGVHVGGMAAFREQVRSTMQREMDQAVKDQVKAQVMDALMVANPIQLPKALVDEEIQRIKEQGRDFNVIAQSSEEKVKALTAGAERRVALGLILSEVVQKNQFKAAPEKVREAVDAIAATYEHPEEVVRWYYMRRERLMNVEALVLEDQATAWLIQQADVSEKPMSFEELVNPDR